MEQCARFIKYNQQTTRFAARTLRWGEIKKLDVGWTFESHDSTAVRRTFYG